MHWFCPPGPQHRPHHLPLVPIDSPLWRDRLAFRDALRHDPALREAHAALQQRLALVHRDGLHRRQAPVRGAGAGPGGQRQPGLGTLADAAGRTVALNCGHNGRQFTQALPRGPTAS